MKPLRLAAALAVFSVTSSCGGTTGGALVKLPFRIGGVDRDPAQALTFTTNVGWSVQLDDAVIALGPFYFNVDPPQTHTFHSGVFIVQGTAQVLVNVLDPALYDMDGGADGETGHAIAAEIELYPPDGSGDTNLTDLLGNSQGFVKGTATRTCDGLVIPFEGNLTIDQTLVTPPQPLPYLQRVSGAVCDLTFTDQPQALTLRVDPTHWFDNTGFASLAPADTPVPLCELPDGGPVPIPDGGLPLFANPLTWTNQSSFHQELMSGIQSRIGVYDFSLTSP